MNPAKAATVVTFPILLTGFFYLNLGELLLQAALYRLAFLQFLPRPSSSIASSTSALSGKGLAYMKALTPTFFPLPEAARGLPPL